ncbi:MAG: S41 family peptidase [bacterium]|nr:S41 family peptidase [bacterium]
MFSGFQKNTVFIVVIVSLVISFSSGFYIGAGQSRTVYLEGVMGTELGKPEGVDFSLFWDAWRVVQEKFATKEPLNVQSMVYGAISGMLGSLEDPYTIFMNPEDSKKFFDDLEGSFEGVGMEIGIRNKALQVISPLEGTPAKRAGVRAGDRIIKIGDVVTDGMSVEKAVSLIRGPKGTSVTLTVFREGWEETKEISIVRDVIIIPSLEWELKGDVAYIKLFQFSEKAGRDFRKASQEIIASAAKSIVLDVRNNPGGFLDISVDIAGWFLERGSVVVTEELKDAAEQRVHEARGTAGLISYPTVVLINEGSASASEILAGALRDNRGILLIGAQSFGKGSVQEIQNLRDNSSLKVTVAKWLTPKGSVIQDVGLKPDIEVENTSEDEDKDLDPQLDKALEVVKDL